MAANVLTVDPADLPTGSEAEIALIPGNEFVRLRVVSEPGGAGSVTSVTGVAPIVVSPSTGAVTISTTLPADAWPVTSEIAASVVNPQIAQAQQTAPNPTPPDIIVAASDAATGSNDPAGRAILMSGLSDGTSTGNPARTLILQPTINGTPEAKIASAKILWQGNFTNVSVSSIGVGDNSSVGTQLVLGSVPTGSNSVVSHAYIGVFSLDNATHGQAFVQIHDEDGSGTIPGAFYCYFDVFTSGAQPDDGMVLARNQHTAGTGGSHYIEGTNNTTFPTPAPVRRWSIDENAGQGNLVFYDTNGTSTAAANAWIRLPWGNGNLVQPIIKVLNSAGSADQTILQVAFGELFIGDTAAFNRVRLECISQMLFENVDAVSGTGSWTFQNNTLGELFQIQSNPSKPIIHGGAVGVHDGIRRSIDSTNFTGGAAVTIATIDLADNCTTALSVKVTLRDTVTQTDFCVATLQSGYAKVAGVITSPAVAGVPVDVAHTVAAAGVAASLAFSVSGGNILVTINSFGANLLHSLCAVREDVNTGLA